MSGRSSPVQFYDIPLRRSISPPARFDTVPQSWLAQRLPAYDLQENDACTATFLSHGPQRLVPAMRWRDRIAAEEAEIAALSSKQRGPARQTLPLESVCEADSRACIALVASTAEKINLSSPAEEPRPAMMSRDLEKMPQAAEVACRAALNTADEPKATSQTLAAQQGLEVSQIAQAGGQQESPLRADAQTAPGPYAPFDAGPQATVANGAVLEACAASLQEAKDVPTGHPGMEPAQPASVISDHENEATGSPTTVQREDSEEPAVQAPEHAAPELQKVATVEESVCLSCPTIDHEYEKVSERGGAVPALLLDETKGLKAALDPPAGAYQDEVPAGDEHGTIAMVATLAASPADDMQNQRSAGNANALDREAVPLAGDVDLHNLSEVVYDVQFPASAAETSNAQVDSHNEAGADSMGKKELCAGVVTLPAQDKMDLDHDKPDKHATTPAAEAERSTDSDGARPTMQQADLPAVGLSDDVQHDESCKQAHAMTPTAESSAIEAQRSTDSDDTRPAMQQTDVPAVVVSDSQQGQCDKDAHAAAPAAEEVSAIEADQPAEVDGARLAAEAPADVVMSVQEELPAASTLQTGY